MDTIKWGIIGCGDVTERKSGPAFNKIENSQLVAVMRRTPGLAEDYAKRHGVPKYYTEAQNLIDDSDVNAIYIATPPNVHLEYTKMAAKAQKPIYVEKPMAINYKEACQMVEICEKSNVPLFVAYYRRKLPLFEKVRELLNTKAIGEVRLINLNLLHPAGRYNQNDLPWRLRPEISGGGLFYDLGSHQIDLLEHFFGPIVSVRGHANNQAGRYPAEDMVTASLLFETGVMATCAWSFAVGPATRNDYAEIVGTAGKIVFSSFDNQPARFWHENGHFEEFDIPHPETIQQPLIQTVVDELQGKGKCPSNGQSGARTNWVMEELTKEFYQK